MTSARKNAYAGQDVARQTATPATGSEGGPSSPGEDDAGYYLGKAETPVGQAFSLTFLGRQAESLTYFLAAVI
jgi:hypothetical protein